MAIAVENLWEDVLSLLKPQMNDESFDLWFRPIKALSLEGGRLVLQVPNAFFADWLRDHYQNRIQELLQDRAGETIALSFQVLRSADDSVAPIPAIRKPVAVAPPPLTESYLNPRYTFETFVVGHSNRFAQAASQAVANDPGKAYNPLFLYGGVGLGKTHLMHAIGHHMIKSNPHARVLYTTSEKFINEFIDSLRFEKMNQFRQRYRNLDCLLIDDIQFLVNKESSQEEFFYTFNTLYDSRKQIVISSDRPPKEIPTLQERLITRFEWGVVADIQAPELETRVAILREKAEAEHLYISDDVILFLASHVRKNIRELEGSLIRVVAHASLTGVPLTVDSARETLRDVIAREEAAAPVSIDRIQEVVARHYHVELHDMKSKRRTDAIAFPRQIAMYLARTLTDMSTTQIGDSFGGKDHTTVMHGANKVKARLESDPFFAALINKIIHEIKTGTKDG
ncbi:MAG TPA: chromosomal replication initiator protein DnaA [Elusimicrobiota bacterium]|nr:chromosomal replication initiator protein DnaA [Elusimicrobiota bacterium]